MPAKKSRRVADPQKKGRKRWELTPEIKEKLRKYAACGLTKQEICEKLGIGHNTFYARLRENPEVVTLIEDGRTESKAAVTGKLFEMALRGNTKAAELYLRYVHRMADRTEIQVAGSMENPLTLYLSKLTPAEVEEKYQRLLKKSKE